MAHGAKNPEKGIENAYQAVRDVVMVDVCAVCTHSRTEPLRGRLACSVIEVDCRAPGA
jgi:hypothetical protein